MGSTQDEAVQLFNDATLCVDPTDKARSVAQQTTRDTNPHTLHAYAGGQVAEPQGADLEQRCTASSGDFLCD